MMYDVNSEFLKCKGAVDELQISLAGVMPAFEETRIDIIPARLEAGLCICIARCRSLWELIPGCEAVLNKLCLVVRTGVAEFRKRAVRKFVSVYKGAKSLVCFHAPRFLRL